MAQIVEGGNVAELSRSDRVITKVYLDAASLLQLEECGVHQSAKILINGISIVAIEVVKRWILCKAPEEIGPCKIVCAVFAISQSP